MREIEVGAERRTFGTEADVRKGEIHAHIVCHVACIYRFHVGAADLLRPGS